MRSNYRTVFLAANSSDSELTHLVSRMIVRTGWPHLSRDLDEFLGDSDDDPFARANDETDGG